MPPGAVEETRLNFQLTIATAVESVTDEVLESVRNATMKSIFADSQRSNDTDYRPPKDVTVRVAGGSTVLRIQVIYENRYSAVQGGEIITNMPNAEISNKIAQPVITGANSS